MTIEEILRYHATAYPKMCPTDAVKLLYQNEFGGGHLIRDPNQSLEWIKKEYADIKHDKMQPLTIPIGNGIVRYNLHALNIEEMPLNSLNEIFVESSSIVCGSMDSFIEKLQLLIDLTDRCLFTFTSDEIRDYISAYEKQGYPSVSHSPVFRQAYSPSYRVVLQELLPM